MWEGEKMSFRAMPWVMSALCLTVLLSGAPVTPLKAIEAGQPAASPARVVAVVDGKEITEQELLERVRGEVLKLEAQIYDVRRNGVDELISEYLVEQVAKARGLSVDQLMQQEVDSKVGEVTAKEVEEFYAANQARIRKPLHEIQPQVINYLQQSKLTEA